MSKRLSRFLIDKVDERLGDVRKEKVFDLIMIAVGAVVTLVGIYVLLFRADAWLMRATGIVIIIAGCSLAYIMTREYIQDCKKEKEELRHY
ncbi:MAG: hypothetical protein J6W94_06060 [Bacteroidales bacterium]|nr:hypothetical protein [Bacteroidales bacterium]